MPKAIDTLITPTRRAILQFSHAALIAGSAAPVSAAAAPGADAELIALCDRRVAIEDEIAALVATRNTIADEQRTEPQLAAMLADGSQVFDRICEQPDVTTMAGALAMARASIAIAPQDTDGQIIWAGDSEYLAWSVVEFLIGKTVA